MFTIGVYPNFCGSYSASWIGGGGGEWEWGGGGGGGGFSSVKSGFT